jgi:hypothetical protein
VKGMASVYKPLPREIKKTDDPKQEVERSNTIDKYEEEEDVAFNRNSKVSKSQRFRYRLWAFLHRLQGFEMRFALKVAVVTSLLSVPAWLSQSRGWWNENESWWAVVLVWIMMHPRWDCLDLSYAPGSDICITESEEISKILSLEPCVASLEPYGVD